MVVNLLLTTYIWKKIIVFELDTPTLQFVDSHQAGFFFYMLYPELKGNIRSFAAHIAQKATKALLLVKNTLGDHSRYFLK